MSARTGHTPLIYTCTTLGQAGQWAHPSHTRQFYFNRSHRRRKISENPMASVAPKLMPPLARLARGAFSGSITRAHVATGTHPPHPRLLARRPAHRHGRLRQVRALRRRRRRRVASQHLPNGVDAEHRGFVSADLSFSGYATATYRVSILDSEGNPVHSRAAGPHKFNPSGLGWFYSGRSEPTAIRDLVATDELKRSAPFLLRDDCLNVRCDVSMVKMETKPKKWFVGFGSNNLFLDCVKYVVSSWKSILLASE